MAKTSGVWSVLGALVALGFVSGCSDPWQSSGTLPNDGVPVADSLTLFRGKVTRASTKVAPIAGGTLLVTRDQHAIASDPDRDQVYIVDLTTEGVMPVALAEGDEPGRAVEGPAGTVYVAARNGGVVAAIDVATATATRIPVCAAPRGLAYDDASATLYVACRSGALVALDTSTNEVAESFQLDGDLRDVVVSGDQLVVSRFKNAEIMVVSRAGEVLRRSTPKLPATGTSLTPTVAYRTLAAPGGGVLVGHVDSSNVTLPSGNTAGAYYGAPCGGSVADLSLTLMDTQAVPTPGSTQAPIATAFTQAMGGASGPLDLAFTDDGSKVAIVAAGNSWSPDGVIRPNLFIADSAALQPNVGLGLTCAGSTGTTGSSTVPGEPVAVAFDELNNWVVQSRQPAQLQLQSGSVIPLAGDDRTDTGLAMFYMNTGGGISCQSCHPEAGEDGHAWNFSVGLRRSQDLAGGASKRAPFHWSGDLADFDHLFDEVMVKRMSLAPYVTPEQRGALREWIDTVPRQLTADGLDSAAVERGRVLFSDETVACAKCHGGDDYSDNQLHDVGTGAAFITPSLVGVNTRAPLFHDGCATTLTARFGPCGGGDAHGVTSHLSDAERDDLVAFMKSL
jgi:mono/diheme cytochrome c family protein